MQSTARESGKNSREISRQRVLHQTRVRRCGPRARECRVPSGIRLPSGVGGRAGFRLDLDFLGPVVEQADADVVEAEILLDLAHDLAQHLHRIVAGNRGPRNVVEECELPRAPLLFREQARIFDGHRNLSGGGHQHFQIALLEDEFPVGIHRDHDSGGPVAQENRRGDQTLRRTLRNMRNAQPRARRFQIGADQQRLAGADHVFSERVAQFARALGQHAVVAHFEFEADLVAFLEGNIKVAGVENLSQFDLDGAQHLVLIQARADGLARSR